MYCEKCGKMNADGAIFCSNCSTILRSKRQVAEPAEEGTKRFSVVAENNIPVKEESVAVKEPAVKEEPEVKEAPKRKYPDFDELFAKTEEPSKSRRRAEPSYLDDDYDNKKPSSAWFGILAATSWLVFIAFAAIGIISGGLLLIYGLNNGQSMSIFGGIAALIICFAIGLIFLSKNMIYINMAKSINEIKNRK